MRPFVRERPNYDGNYTHSQHHSNIKGISLNLLYKNTLRVLIKRYHFHFEYYKTLFSINDLNNIYLKKCFQIMYK